MGHGSSSPSCSTDPIPAAVAKLRAITGRESVDLAIICGSGLGGLYRILESPQHVSYTEVPGFAASTVPGHAGELVFGTLGGKSVMLMRGRFHAYEGYQLSQVSLPVRVFAALGCKAVIVTNAAGGVDPSFNVGDIMIIKDHIYFPGLAGNHPLVGQNDARFGTRFPAVAKVYNDGYGELVRVAAEKLGLGQYLREGVYCGVSGPSFETPTEIGLCRLVGGGSVGMSTVPEVVTAAHCQMQVLGLSLITNKCIARGDEDTPLPTHAEVLEATQQRTKDMESLVAEVVGRMSLGDEVARPPAYEHFKGGDAGAKVSSKVQTAVKPEGGRKGVCPFTVGVTAAAAGAVAGGLVVAGWQAVRK